MSPPAFHIGAIHIIESLRPGDARTGERLLDLVEPLAASTTPHITTHFKRLSTRNEFLQHLCDVEAFVYEHRRSPLLQIETHGSPDGLQLSAGDFLTWQELKEPLTRINAACRLNLIVVLAACDGAHLVSLIQPADRAPGYALIGPTRRVNSGEIEDAHQSFYRKLFATRDAVPAWMAMNEAVREGDSPFALTSAQRMFALVMKAYFEKMCSGPTLEQRIERLLASARANGAPAEAVHDLRTRVTAYLLDHAEQFAHVKQHFFFLDLHPGNAARFPVTLESLGPLAGQA